MAKSRTSKPAVKPAVKRKTATDKNLAMVLNAVELSLSTLIHSFHHERELSFDAHSDVIWDLMKAVCRARGVKIPDMMPDEWPLG